ncbi:MAG: hypothetical protein LBE59_10165 [Nevskiaceae bacterium]|jgi:hypothetical protein|nr:hypothetical protein [Nevskiaceae bacterium]
MATAATGGKTAVVAVHGIADQKPGETVEQLAQLLCHGEPGEALFEVGEAREVRIPVTRLEVQASSTEVFRGFSRWQKDAKAKKVKSSDLNSYFLSRLKKLPDEDMQYRSSCIGVEHCKTGAQVDLFEMYWADLSRLGQGGLAVLNSLFHLPMSLSSLSADVVDQAVARSPDSGALVGLRWLYASSAWLLRGPALLIQLCMLLLLLPGGFSAVPDAARGNVLLLLFCGGAFALVFWIWAQIRRAKLRRAKLLGLLFFANVGLAVYTFLNGESDWIYLGVIVVLMTVAGGWLVRSYSQVMHGYIERVGYVLIFGTVVVLLLAVRYPFTEPFSLQQMRGDSLKTWEILFLAFLVVWAAFVVLQLVAIAWGLAFRWRFTTEQAVKDSLYTAQLGLVTATALFLTPSLVLWSALGQLLGRWLQEPYLALLPGKHCTGAAFLAQWIGQFNAPYLAPLSGKHCTGEVFLAQWVGQFNEPFLLLVVSAGVLVIAGLVVLAPSLLEEISPSGSKGFSAQDAPKWASRLGRWLSVASCVFGFVVRVGLPLGAVIGGVCYLYFLYLLSTGASALLGDTGSALMFAGKWLVGGTATVMAFGGRFVRTVGRLRAGLDAVTDVSNYFEDPSDGQSPRARIFSRYNSLLCYLRKHDYQRIVIVAHSQGTVISADLLRYLSMHPSLEEKPSLITVGSPLRALYAKFFPLPYEWMDEKPKKFEDAKPTAAEIGVSHWVSGCCSGDYVGRFLWTPEERKKDKDGASTDGASWDGQRTASYGDRTEFCLGAGGHTHYFSPDARALAQQIERLAVQGEVAFDQAF